MGKVLQFPIRQKTLTIQCPIDHKTQIMAYDRTSTVWYPLAPFCCEVMRQADTPEWNTLLDAEIARAINEQQRCKPNP